MIPHHPQARQSLARVAFSALLQWRILLIWLVLTLIPTIVFCLPLGRFLSRQLDHSVHSIEWATTISVLVLSDLGVNNIASVPLLGALLLVSVLLTLLLWPLLSGMVVGAARMNRPLGFVALLQAGVAEYGRMLRMLIWSVVPLGIALGIGGALVHMAGDRAEKAILESQVSLEQNLALLVLAVLFVCAHVSVEAGRAQFALEAHRRSAIRAWWRGVRLVWAKPLAAIGTYLLISLVGLAVIAVLGLLRINLPHAAFPGFVVALVLTELIAIATVWMRIARLLVLIQIGRSRPTGLPNEVRT